MNDAKFSFLPLSSPKHRDYEICTTYGSLQANEMTNITQPHMFSIMVSLWKITVAVIVVHDVELGTIVHLYLGGQDIFVIAQQSVWKPQLHSFYDLLISFRHSTIASDSRRKIIPYFHISKFNQRNFGCPNKCLGGKGCLGSYSVVSS